MSKPSSKRTVPNGHVTRKQQVRALKELKAQEIGENVADRIREAVKDEVSKQLKPIVDTMTDLIDRVLDLETHQAKTFAPTATVESGQMGSASVPTLEVPNEGDGSSGQPGEETAEVPVDDQVVQGPSSEGDDPPGTDEARDIARG